MKKERGDNMARPRKPASLNTSSDYTEGERQKRIKVEDELRGNSNHVMDIPDHLDEMAKEYYSFITRELEVSNLLSDLDIPLVEQTADALSKVRQADEIINQEGIMIVEFDRAGNEIRKEHPLVNTKIKYLKEFRQMSTQLGMSPSSRAELAVLKIEKEEEDNNPLLNILNRNSSEVS